MTRDVATVLALLNLPGVGNAMARHALAAAAILGTSVYHLTRLTPSRLIQCLPAGDFHALATCISHCSEDAIAKEHQWFSPLSRMGARAVLASDSEYPALLANALGDQAPALVFYAGNDDLLRVPGVAIVGSRNVGDRGARLAHQCAKFACNAGQTIVSGAATGVDSVAHSTALNSGGKTIMVVPMGLLQFPISAKLRSAIDEGRLLVLSEFSPSTPWQTHNAVTRNATIAALARLICVVEPRRAGGSARTAQWGLVQRKPVFIHVAPGQRILAKSLTMGGALPLLDENGGLDLTALSHQLDQSSTSTPTVQGQLF